MANNEWVSAQIVKISEAIAIRDTVTAYQLIQEILNSADGLGIAEISSLYATIVTEDENIRRFEEFLHNDGTEITSKENGDAISESEISEEAISDNEESPNDYREGSASDVSEDSPAQNGGS